MKTHMMPYLYRSFSAKELCGYTTVDTQKWIHQWCIHYCVSTPLFEAITSIVYPQLQGSEVWIHHSRYITTEVCIHNSGYITSIRGHHLYCVSTTTGWQRPIWCLIFIGHFQQKSPVIGDSFAKRDLQLRTSYASSPPCSEGYELCILSWQKSYMWLLQKSPTKERLYSAKKTYTLLCIETHILSYVFVHMYPPLYLEGIS